MPPRDPQPANSRRKSNLNLDVQEPALTTMLEKYCDLRRRGFGQQAIQTKASWPRHYPSLLLEEAQRRKMPGSQGSQKQAVTEWLLAMFDAAPSSGSSKGCRPLLACKPRRSCKPPWTPPVDQLRPASSSGAQTESQPEYPI